MTAFPLDSGGTVTVNLCEDESPAIALGAPAGWVHARCPVTCGIPCLSTPLQCVPALDTCDGAVGYFVTGLQSDLQDPTCPTEPVEKDGLVEQVHTLASCGNSTACKDFIGSIDDKAAAMLKTGLASCAGFPGKEGYVFYQQYLHCLDRECTPGRLHACCKSTTVLQLHVVSVSVGGAAVSHMHIASSGGAQSRSAALTRGLAAKSLQCN